MRAATPIRAAALAGLFAGLACWAVASDDGASAAEFASPPSITVAASDFESRHVELGVGKSVVIDLPRDIKDVLVADPKTVNAVVRSARRLYFIGIRTGATNIFIFDAAGRQMAAFSITVARDVAIIRDAIRRLIPDSEVNVESIGDGIILTGTVANQAEAQQAYAIASHFIATGSDFSANSGGGPNFGGASSSSNGGGTSTVVNLGGANGGGSSDSGKVYSAIVVRGRDQVMLKVTVAEVDRQIIKQLGINLSGGLGYGTAVVNFNNNAANPGIASGYSPPNFPINGTPLNTLTGTFKNGLTATLQAMDQAGVVRTLAEPTLTAISGESAHFLVGGMFPYPSVQSCSVPPCPPTIQFQNFGVSLTFNPIVLAEGRISLNMLTEVSELSSQNSVTVAGTTVPGLTVRRADTTVEIPSGGSLAIAGMIQEQTKQDITGFPGLMEVPILGTLFKSRDYLNNLTELVIIVTPYVVRAVAEKDLSRPDDGFADPSDPSAVLLGRLNRIYGVGGVTDPPDNYRGKYGFILD